MVSKDHHTAAGAVSASASSAGMILVFSLDILSPSFSGQTNHAQTLISEFLDLPLQYIFLLCYSLVKSFIVVLRMVDSVPVGLTSI